MSEANLRRLITGLERRLNCAWSLYVTGYMCLVGAAVVFVAGCLIGACGWGYRAW